MLAPSQVFNHFRLYLCPTHFGVANAQIEWSNANIPHDFHRACRQQSCAFAKCTFLFAFSMCWDEKKTLSYIKGKQISSSRRVLVAKCDEKRNIWNTKKSDHWWIMRVYLGFVIELHISQNLWSQLKTIGNFYCIVHYTPCKKNIRLIHLKYRKYSTL